MTQPQAYCFYQEFPPELRMPVCFDRHYLMYSAKGSIALEVDGRAWTLPPMRAAWIRANVALVASNPQPITCCSVLYEPGFIDEPDAPCRVFNITPLAREMILECRRWGPEAVLDAHAMQFMLTLASVARELARAPCQSWVPVGQSKAVRAAIAHSQQHLGTRLEFGAVASTVHAAPRSLARHFQAECGMSWQQVLRRLRMIKAAELLATPSAQITQIAFAVGYDSLSAFSAAFRAFSGDSPRAYRQGLAAG